MRFQKKLLKYARDRGHSLGTGTPREPARTDTVRTTLSDQTLNIVVDDYTNNEPNVNMDEVLTAEELESKLQLSILLKQKNSKVSFAHDCDETSDGEHPEPTN